MPARNSSTGNGQLAPNGFSFGRLAAMALGAAVVGILVTTLLVFVVPTAAKLPVALLGLVASMVVMALVARRYVDRTLGEEKPPSDGKGGGTSGRKNAAK